MQVLVKESNRSLRELKLGNTPNIHWRDVGVFPTKFLKQMFSRFNSTGIKGFQVLTEERLVHINYGKGRYTLKRVLENGSEYLWRPIVQDSETKTEDNIVSKDELAQRREAKRKKKAEPPPPPIEEPSNPLRCDECGTTVETMDDWNTSLTTPFGQDSGRHQCPNQECEAMQPHSEFDGVFRLVTDGFMPGIYCHNQLIVTMDEVEGVTEHANSIKFRKDKRVTAYYSIGDALINGIRDQIIAHLGRKAIPFFPSDADEINETYPEKDAQ